MKHRTPREGKTKTMRLRGKQAVITGTATGIGRQTALLFALEGAQVIAVDRDEANNVETARLISGSGGICRAITADISEDKAVVGLFSDLDAIDILVNNAASVSGDGFLTDLSAEAWDSVLGICLRSVFLCSREALKMMMPQKSGVIVNLSSANAAVGINLAAYTAAKGGIESLTRLTAAHYARFGIRANSVSPGTVMSENSEEFYRARPTIASDLKSLYPGSEFGHVRDIAATILFLASDEAKFINGAIIPVDGGLTSTRRLPSIAP
jgi:NAD(P)-dependent dehydrogenase (short-subunit alcohol dehydrogenase family)